MKTTTDKTFDAVKFMRAQREKLSEKLSKMSKEEVVEYFRRKKLENSIKPSA
jgi:c-di-AMP phosphodiesterase-like protein